MKNLPGQMSFFDEVEEPEISEYEITRCLLRGSPVAGGNCRILKQYQSGSTPSENAEFLRKEFGIGGMWPAFISGEKEFSLDYSGSGVRIGLIWGKASVKLSWLEVEKRIQQMITDRIWKVKE